MTLLIIVYSFLPDFLIHIDSRSLMITRSFQEDDSPIVALRASVYLPALQAIPSLALGDSAYGMIHLDYRLALEEIHFDCQRCRMQRGSSGRRRKIICRSETLRLRVVSIRARKALALLDHQWQTDSSHKHFVRRNFIHG